MWPEIDYWKFLAGLGLFLFAMQMVEEALKFLASRPFKKILRQHTNKPSKAIFIGALATAFLQSSSVVTLMLLAFVGSGVIYLRNALGIILGSNLGTTVTGWIVSYLGFKVDFGASVLPFLATGTLFFIFFQKFKLVAEWGRFFAGFGLLFFGLNFMKEGLAPLQQSFDPAILSGYGSYVFLVAGFVFTAIVQSSSATMVVTLTALNAGVLNLTAAAALIIGADLGTTMTAVLGALAGSAEKKRVAAAHFLFNLVSDSLAYLLLPRLLGLVVYLVGESNPLYGLVLFHSGFNFLGILLFWPFLQVFARWLESWFREEQNGFRFVGDIDPRAPEASLAVIKSGAHKLLSEALNLNLLGVGAKKDHDEFHQFWLRMREDDYLERYSNLKSSEAFVIEGALHLQGEALTADQRRLLAKIHSGLHHLATSTKAIKDILHNLEEFRNSSDDVVHGLHGEILRDYLNWGFKLKEMVDIRERAWEDADLHQFSQINEESYGKFTAELNRLIHSHQLPSKHIASLFNATREIYLSNQEMIAALRDLN